LVLIQRPALRGALFLENEMFKQGDKVWRAVNGQLVTGTVNIVGDLVPEYPGEYVMTLFVDNDHTLQNGVKVEAGQEVYATAAWQHIKSN
jgi:hypothetical protein